VAPPSADSFYDNGAATIANSFEALKPGIISMPGFRKSARSTREHRRSGQWFCCSDGNNAIMWRARRGHNEEVDVLREEDAAVSECVGECSESSAPKRFASAVVVTSTPSNRSPPATAVATCSSRWKRSVRGILLCQPCVDLRWPCLSLQLSDQLVFILDVLMDFVAMRPIVGKCGMHLGHR
jgi:hypothetical protein